MKILLIEDEPTLCAMIVEYLHTEGYIVETATTFKEADEKSYVYEYDCLLVDIGLPDGNGLDIIKNLKQRRGGAGVIIISAKNSLDDRVQGLELGSDDYLPKPFHLAELNARLRALMRRRKFDGHTELIFNELKIVTDEMRVFVNTDEIVLTKKEYDLLLYFLTNKNRILTKESVVEHAWGDAIEQADSYDFIYTHIKNLRKKLMDKGCADYLKSVYGVGYKWTDR